MSVSVSIPTTVQIRRSRLMGLIALVAVLAAAVTSIVLTIAFDGGTSATASSLQRTSNRSASAVEDRRVSSTVTVTRAQGEALASMALPDGIMSLTPAQLAAGASVLGSMSPATRRYTEAVMNLTFAQLAAGAAGQP
jgi:hypothetical protein